MKIISSEKIIELFNQYIESGVENRIEFGTLVADAQLQANRDAVKASREKIAEELFF